MGGAQSIAAMAFGTGNQFRVDKITGPEISMSPGQKRSTAVDIDTVSTPANRGGGR